MHIQALGEFYLDRLQHDDCVVDHNSDRQHQSEQRQVIERKTHQVHHGERPDERTGTSIIGKIIAFQSCRNSSTTIATRITASRNA